MAHGVQVREIAILTVFRFALPVLSLPKDALSALRQGLIAKPLRTLIFNYQGVTFHGSTPYKR